MSAHDMPTLGDRILALIATATSKRPANAADVLALVGGAEAAYWAAIEQLTRDAAINTAHIQRPATDPAPWLALWPTGLRPESAGWTGKRLSALFVQHRPNALREAHGPRSNAAPAKPNAIKETAMPATAVKKSRAAADANRNTIAELVRGRTAANGLFVSAIAGHIQLTTQGADYLIGTMIPTGRVARTRLPGEQADRIYDPSAMEVAATQPVAAPQADRPAYRHDDIQVRELVAGDAPSDPPQMEIRFALWDDGSLSVCDGDELTLLPAAAVNRLALLLGVPAAGGPASN